MLTARAIIDALGLEPLPVEGGMFRQTFLAAETIAAAALPERYARDKALSTAIYYLLDDAPDSFSALHRLPTDEVYHFYLGDPVELLVLPPGGRGEVVRLGQDLEAGMRVQTVVAAGCWQGSRLADGRELSLLGATMAPGFEWQDFEAGDGGALSVQYPDFRQQIKRLIRE